MPILPHWPPELLADEQANLIRKATDWALSHSLILRPNPPNYNQAIHGPFALFPTPFPRHLFDRVCLLQQAYNDLYVNLASDEQFLEEVIGRTVAVVDDFQRALWQIWKTVSTEGIAQPLTLGLFRSDYLLHNEARELKQVEFNTISSSFGPLATRVSELHRFLIASGAYPSKIDHLNLSNIPTNEADKRLAAGLAQSHKAYGSQTAIILMVVQDPERNAFDQRILEWHLLEIHGIRLIRKSFSQLDEEVQLDTNKALTLQASKQEISVVYFRAGYTPRDYPSDQEWATRLLLERSKAVKCPSIALQLAGAKKVQQVLATHPELVYQHLSLEYRSQLEDLRETFMGMWPMDSSEAGTEGQRLAKAEPERFVLKPQREGGGNNIYKLKIPPALVEMQERDRRKAKNEPRKCEGYILMELIKPPQGLHNILVRAGEGQGQKCEVVSELGIYGVCLFQRRQDGTGAEILVNEMAGHLLRTKGSDDDEGGVAVGFSVIDSPLLVQV